MLKQALGEIEVRASAPGLHEITGEIERWLKRQPVGTGLLTLFCRHTSASLLIQENAAAAVRRDLQAFFDRTAPEDPALYTHNDEGSDDMPAHIRSALTNAQLSIPVRDNRMTLGAWQGIFLFEHRHSTPRRRLALHLVGE